MNVTVDQVYTSVACNRIPEVADWNNEGLICFGATNAVVVYDTKQKDKNPLSVLCHHKSKVNSVKWLQKSDGTCTEFVSCSADKTVAIWTLLDGTWKVTSSLKGHNDGVTCIHGIYTNECDLVIYSGSIDSTVKVWERCNGVSSLKQTINLNSGLCLTLCAHLLPKVIKPILFCALDDHKIHLFAGEDYHRVHTLVGHEDWVRGLDVLNVDESSILLASASQDTYIRLWRINLYEDIELSSEIRIEGKLFTAYDRKWSVKLDAVLAGHEGWVYAVQWHPVRYDEECKVKAPVFRLLSSSLDKTLIIWEPECAELGKGAWVERVRVGEVGGNGLGFYGSRFGPGGKSFLGHGYNGSFHMWALNVETKQWQPQVVCGGHFGSVEDTRWEPGRGRYLLSVSTDQTTRLHAPWNTSRGRRWHEIARPQVHGYDMASIAPVGASAFASAADEKVVRVFSAPHNFLHNFASIVGERLTDGQTEGPEGASVPSLGLSNKAVFSENQGDGDETDGYFVPVVMNEPPTEETLMQNTLWPESQKLYGHGYEVYALDATGDGQLLASACKSTSEEHAAVLIWETSSWQQIQRLVAHQLTVTQLAFSPDGRRLLSASRDRKWALFLRAEGSLSFGIVARTDRTNGVHARIVWCCAWAPDGAAFATGSRDGKVCVWAESDRDSGTSLRRHTLLGKPLELPVTSVTALAFAPFPLGTARVLATGFESGVIRMYVFRVVGWTSLLELGNSAAHHLAVKRLTFNPVFVERDATKQVLLASCGGDHLVRIHGITFTL
ncbi:unnamed protein product, partial [Iphiclides podalirius]